MRFRIRRWHIPILVLLALAAVAAILYAIPSGEYLYVPDRAIRADPLVTVPDDKNAGGPGGIYMVDVRVRSASLLERLIPGLNSGASLVPAERVNPLGVSDAERQQSGKQDMQRSQQLAAVVALRSLGYHVGAEPNGVTVNQVDPDAPGAAHFEIGDRIVRIAGRPIRTTTDLRDAMGSVTSGDTVDVTVQRQGGLEQLHVPTESAAGPGGGKRPVFGILVVQNADVHLPIDISIDARNIGGPSAGLAFALDIIDELGPDIDRGRRIVATGEIGIDGTVGPIGGIKQKTIGARESDADLFLVPKANAADARRYADGLRIVPVSNFKQALAAVEAR